MGLNSNKNTQIVDRTDFHSVDGRHPLGFLSVKSSVASFAEVLASDVASGLPSENPKRYLQSSHSQDISGTDSPHYTLVFSTDCTKQQCKGLVNLIGAASMWSAIFSGRRLYHVKERVQSAESLR